MLLQHDDDRIRSIGDISTHSNHLQGKIGIKYFFLPSVDFVVIPFKSHSSQSLNLITYSLSYTHRTIYHNRAYIILKYFIMRLYFLKYYIYDHYVIAQSYENN